jgi:hypothetical protein
VVIVFFLFFCVTSFYFDRLRSNSSYRFDSISNKIIQLQNINKILFLFFKIFFYLNARRKRRTNIIVTVSIHADRWDNEKR